MSILCKPSESMDCGCNILSDTFSFNGYLFDMVFKKTESDWLRHRNGKWLAFYVF